jgi:hypothetical protein
VYCLDDSLPFLIQFLTPVGTNTIPQADAYLEFFNIAVGGCCDAGSQKMAVELLSDDCAETGTCVQLFIGMNNLGEFAPTYITAPDCGIVDPYADSFLLWHLIMVVNGEGEIPDDGGGDGGMIDAVQEAKLLPADETGSFGESVALDGDTALIGAASDHHNGLHSGSAYVFTRTGGVWTQQAKLLPADGDSLDQFGGFVALDGDTALIGADNDDDNGNNSGSTYVFTRAGGVWSQQAKLQPADGDSGDHFGGDVALEGDTAVISAGGDDDNGNDSGSAYVFTRTGGVWSQQTKLMPADGDAGDRFGSGVALDGNTALIGASLDDANGAASGSAYVFTRTGDAWSERAKLLATDGKVGDLFGYSVALDGDKALIGAGGDDHNGYDTGSAYVFTRNGDVWTQQAKISAADGDNGDLFGRSVALHVDTAVIGAWQDQDNGFRSGSAYVFTRSGSDWIEQVKLLAADGGVWDQFGYSVAVDGDIALIGAPGNDDNGSAYVFRLIPDQDVPAAGSIGIVLLLLAVLGTGVYFSRRRFVN